MASSSSHKLKIDSYDTNTEKATLYDAAHTAQVQRRFEVALKPGKTQIDIENLPNGVEEDTLRVEGYGEDGVSATIVDLVCLPVITSKPFEEAPPKIVQLPSPEVVDLRKKIAYKNTVLQSLDAQETILRNYSNALNPSNTPHSDLDSYLSFCASKTLKLTQSRTKTHEEIQALESEIEILLLPARKAEEKETAQSYELWVRRTAEEIVGRMRRRTVRVLVEVKGDGEEDVKERSVSLVLIYIVRGAGWSPIYDIRAETTPSTSLTGKKERSSPKTAQKDTLSIHYRASITNATGEAWIGTQIVLSTAAPNLGSAIPTLRPYRLGFPVLFQQEAPPRPSPMRASTVASDPRLDPRLWGFTGRVRSRDRAAQAGGGGGGDSDEEDKGPVMVAHRTAEVKEGGGSTTSVVFMIDGTSDIECDGAAHKVSIAVLKLDAEFSRITVPSLAATVFLQASVKNASPYPLLPGPTTIYLDGSLVGRGRMGDVRPGETFKVSLGVDGGVQVTFHPEEKFKSTSGSFLSSTKTENVSFVQKVTIENTKPQPASLLIQSRFPVSEDQKIIVRLVQPSSTLPAVDADGRGGVTRWVEGKKEEGMIEWCGKIGGKEKKVWKYGWEVEGSGWVARR